MTTRDVLVATPIPGFNCECVDTEWSCKNIETTAYRCEITQDTHQEKEVAITESVRSVLSIWQILLPIIILLWILVFVLKYFVWKESKMVKYMFYAFTILAIGGIILFLLRYILHIMAPLIF